MGSGLRTIANYLPLTRLTDAVRAPWLGLGNATASLIVVVIVASAASVVAVRRSAL
jgi:ABC-2 type transport system permease protein